MNAKKHIERIKLLSCACCGAVGPSSCHHLREGQGMAQRASDFLAVPLCYECHQGPRGVHGDRSMMRLMKLTELDMLANTIQVLL